MEFGLNFPARIDAWKDLVAAEDLGFTSAWFYDSQTLNSDVYATMALAAEHTKKIRIERIAVPDNRIAPVTAHSIAASPGSNGPPVSPYFRRGNPINR